MTITEAQFTDAPDASGQSHIVDATIDGRQWQSIDLRAANFNSHVVNAWIATGNLPSPYVAPPAPAITCQLWQLQAVMTPAQWTSVQNFIASMNNPSVLAFFAHGTNQIPSNSTTLLEIGEGIGLTADQITALVTQAAAVSIP